MNLILAEVSVKVFIKVLAIFSYKTVGGATGNIFVINY